VGTVITRSPNSDVPSMMKDFKLAISLFERTAPHSQRAKVALVGPFFWLYVCRYLIFN
jgi:hypothetical protein